METINFKGILFVKRISKTEDGFYKIGYYDSSGLCLISAIDKGLKTTERVLSDKLKYLKY